MAVSVTSLTSDPIREAALPASQSRRNADPVRETVILGGEKKVTEAMFAQASAALVEINQSLKLASVGVQFEFDKEADIMIVKVVDVETGGLIRQLPAEEVVRISKLISKFLGKLQGLLLHRQA